MVSNDQIRQIVAEVLGVDPESLQADTMLYALPSFDSVQLLSLMVALDEIGVVVPPSQVAELRTFNDILALRRR
jgi:acyl carrier protein